MSKPICYDMAEVLAEVERLLRQGMKVSIKYTRRSLMSNYAPAFSVSFSKDYDFAGYLKD